MADEEDPFAAIIDDCHISSSQEYFLAHSKFVREDETFPDDGRKPPPAVGSGRSGMKLDPVNAAGGIKRDESANSAAISEEKRVLGFPEERKSSTIEVVLDGEVRVCGVRETESGSVQVRERETNQGGSSIEPPLKKSRVMGSQLEGGKISPLVQCSEKMAVDSEDKNKQTMVFKGGWKVEIVSPLRCFSQEGADCTEKLVADYDEHSARDDEMRREKSKQAKKKLEFRDDTEVIETPEDEALDEPRKQEMGSGKEVDNGKDATKSREGDSNAKKKLEERNNTKLIDVEEDETDGSKKSEMGSGIDKENVDKGKGTTESRGDDSNDKVENQGKRHLPGSLLGQIWGLDANGGDETRNQGSEEPNQSRGVEENGGQKPRADENMRHLLDALKMLATQMMDDADDGEVDIFETAKKRGMTFPRNRFRVDLEKDK